MSKLCGPDLAWMGYAFDESPTDIFDYGITDQLFLLKGTIVSAVTNSKETTNGIPVFSGPWLYEYPTQYDNSGRIILNEERIDNKLMRTVKIKYYD